MRAFPTGSLLALAGVFTLGAANADPIGLADFDGTESVFDFNSETIGSFLGVFTAPDFSIAAESGSYAVQAGGGGIIGTTGAAFNTVSGVGNADATIVFDFAISMFGMNFGTSSSELLSAVVSAFDLGGNLVESIVLPSFSNTFVGFQFSTSVTSIYINRTDLTNRFTFIDDVRYVPATRVPEPPTLALFGLALIGMTIVRRKA